MIVGSHPHEIQAYEKIDNKHVFYCLGNFVFSEKDFGKNNKKLSESLLVSIEISDNHSYSVNLKTCFFDQTVVRLNSIEDDKEANDYIEKLSSKFNHSSKNYSKLFYDDFTKVNTQRLSNRANKNKCQKKKHIMKRFTLKLRYYVVLFNMLDYQWVKNILYMRLPFLRKLIIKTTGF